MSGALGVRVTVHGALNHGARVASTMRYIASMTHIKTLSEFTETGAFIALDQLIFQPIAGA